MINGDGICTSTNPESEVFFMLVENVEWTWVWLVSWRFVPFKKQQKKKTHSRVTG